MVRLMASEWNFETSKQEIVEMETEVIKLLDWDLMIVSPIFFLERYQRIFGVHQERTNKDDAQVGSLTRKILRCHLLSSSFLRFKPSVMAAAALMLSINISCSAGAQLMLKSQPLYFLRDKAFFRTDLNL